MKKLILHVGMHKTGSSSIQHTLFDKSNKKLLERYNYYYLSNWQSYATQPIWYNIFCSNPTIYHDNIRKNLSPKEIYKLHNTYKDVLMKEIKGSKCDNIIISEEDIYHLDYNGICKLRDYLQSSFQDSVKIEIIIVVRNPYSLVSSRIQENVKYGGSTIEKEIKNEKILWENFINGTISDFIKVFNSSSVKVLMFEKLINHSNGIVGGFLSEIGVKGHILPDINYLRKNESYSSFAINLISFINNNVPLFVEGKINSHRKSWDTNIFGALKGEKFKLKPDQYNKLSNVLDFQITWLKDNLNIVYSPVDNYKNTIGEYEITTQEIKQLRNILPKLSRVLRQQTMNFLYEISTLLIDKDVALYQQLKDLVATYKSYKGKKLILHIGTPKTGTTSLQTTLLKNHKYLESNNVIYPKKMEPQNLSFYPLFLEDPMDCNLWRREINENKSDEKKNEFIEKWGQVLSSSTGNFIISSELLTYYTKEAIIKCKEFLKKYFDEIIVIAYIRKPQDYINSILQQEVKNGYTTIDLTYRLTEIKENGYRTTFIKNWIQVFGIENVIIRPFDSNLLKNGDVIDDFLENTRLSSINPLNLIKQNSNVGIGTKSIAFLNEYNKKYPRLINGKVNKKRGLAKEYEIVDIFANVEDEKFRLDIKFSKEEANKINKEIEYINSIWEDYGYSFEYIKDSDEKTKTPHANEINIEYYIDLINEYNKYIEKNFLEINKKISKNNIKKNKIHESKKNSIFNVINNAKNAFEENTKNILSDSSIGYIIFGHCETAIKLCKKLQKYNLNIICFSTYKKEMWGTQIQGVQVVEPKTLSNITKNNKIIIANKGVNHNLVTRHMYKLGFKKIMHYTHILGMSELPKWKVFNISPADKVDIEKLFDNLSDLKSKKVLFNLIQYRLSFNFGLITEVLDDEQYQYIDKDIVKFDQSEVIIDAGAYNGDTLKKFNSITNGKYKKIYSFEPDKNNFIELSKIKAQINSDNIKIINKGVYYKETTLSFNPNKNSSKFINEGNMKIEVCSIQNEVEDIPTYVKIDVEGSEIDALLGMKEIIRNHKPTLAISIYHRKDDLWRIPNIIKDWVPEYKIYLRHYDACEYETVCYAVI